MAVVYMYEVGCRPQYLYVDEAFDRSQFPEWIKTIITTGEKIGRRKTSEVRLAPKDKEHFKKNGYIELCHIENEYASDTLQH